MAGFRGQEFVVKTAAIADAMTLGVESQTGHQHQRGGVIGHRSVFHRLGNAGITFFHFGEVKIADLKAEMAKAGIPARL